MDTTDAATNHAAGKQREESPPFGRILVPLDGSPLAEEALPAAIAFAQRAGTRGKLFLLHVSRTGRLVYSRAMPPGSDQEVTAYLSRQEAAVQEQGVAVEVVRTAGDAAMGIVDSALTQSADLIVMVTHAPETMSRLVYGSVADRVLQGATVPVLLLKHGEQPITMFSPEQHPHLLIPLDGSALAESVLLRAMALAQQMSAVVTVMRSLNVPELTLEVPGRQYGPADALQVIVPQERLAATLYLERVQQRLQIYGIPTTMCVTEGSAAEDIAEQALLLEDAGQATIIVMATHGRGGCDRWLYGSVAGAVLHRATVPLLVIRPHRGFSSG